MLVDGTVVGSLSMIEKLDAVALETFKLSERPTFFKTLLRAVAKGIVAAKAKQEAQQASAGNSALSLLSLAGGLAADAAVDASEQADLRSARYFPGQAYVGEFSVEPGQHDITIQYCAADGKVLYEDKPASAALSANALNLVASYDLE